MAKLELVKDEWTIPKEYVATAKAIVAYCPEVNAKIPETSFEENQNTKAAFELFKRHFYETLCRALDIPGYPVEYGSMGVSKDGKKLIGYKYIVK